MLGKGGGVFKKMKLCNNFLAGACNRGAMCAFAHGEHELGSPQPAAPQTQHPASGKGGGGFKKTKLCDNFLAGTCNRGAMCNFAHGEHELGSPQTAAPQTQHQAFPHPASGKGGDGFKKTKLCNNFLAGNCNRGAVCTYAHGEHELGSPQPAAPQTQHQAFPQPASGKGGGGFKKTKLCDNFLAGTCNRGALCNFAHGEHELGSPQTAAPQTQQQAFPQPASGKGGGGFKNKLCNNFLAGACSFGAMCHFAHGDHELWPPQLPLDKQAPVAAAPASAPGTISPFQTFLKEAGLENKIDALLAEGYDTVDMLTKATDEHLDKAGLGSGHIQKLRDALLKGGHSDDKSKDQNMLAPPPTDFGTSPFRVEYDDCAMPQFQDEILRSAREIVQEYARRQSIPEAESITFINELNSEWILTDSVPLAVQKAWTSAKALRNREFCSILSEALRQGFAVRATAQLVRALNSNLVTRGQMARGWPKGPTPGDEAHHSTEKDTTWRGGGFKDDTETRAFFELGKQYRVAQPLPTAFIKTVAQQFINRASLVGVVNAYVMWEVRFNATEGCNHVNLLTETHVPGETEFLFAPFSAFTVHCLQWSLTPQNKSTPHKITICAEPNNLDVPLDVPLAPWA